MDLSGARILHISKYYYPFLGGTEQVARNMVKTLLDSGAEQKIICFNEDAEDGNLCCSKGETVTDTVDGIEVIRCGYTVKIASQSLSPAYDQQLKKLMNEFRPDVVIFHYPNPFVAHYLLKYKQRDFKLLVYWHLDITRQRYLKYFVHGQTVSLIRRTDRILGATIRHINESEFYPYFDGKEYILPYMIDEDSFVLSEEEKREAQEIRDRYPGKVLGFFIGRHVFYKGLTYLIHAAKELRDENIQFLIAGSGELTEKLKQEAKNSSNVEFVGRIDDSQRRTYLYASDILCFPSITRNEGFGLTLAEGMYFGHPAVTFTIPGSGVNEVNLDGVTGIECPNGDVQAYAYALRLLCRDKELREQYGAAARQRILDNYTGEIFRENLYELFRTL